MKSLVLIIFTVSLIMCKNSVAQERLDVVYLKNGNVIKGTIIEQTQESIKIETKDGSIFIYKMAEVERITKEKVYDKSSETSESDKSILYESQKKDPAMAVLGGCLLTSVGHAYAGNWPRGLAFSAGAIACVVVAFAGIEEKTETIGTYYPIEVTTTEITPLYWFGLGGALAIRIWELADAANEVKKYNNRLYERIYGRKPSGVGLNLIPTKNGSKIGLVYNF